MIFLCWIASFHDAALGDRDGMLLALMEAVGMTGGTPWTCLRKGSFPFAHTARGGGFVRHTIVFKSRCTNCDGIGKINRVTLSPLGFGLMKGQSLSR